MFERRLYFHFDWLMLAAILAITGIGIAMIYSTTYVTLPEGGHAGPQVRTQVYALVIGLVAFLVFLSLDYRMLAEHSLALYGGLCALLLFVLVKGSTQDFFPNRPLFHLQTTEGTSLEIRCRELKALFFVKDLDGNQARRDLRGFIQAPAENSHGKKLAVRFKDGELMCGYSLSYWSSEWMSCP